ncbi:putative repeat protein (TIGR02543 family) [Aurantimicrobium minutum]|uniref:InlB B-repeat-containing protein n=1 Tax=Aurantimicrobium minutum TaxID=708131 RepID=UPI00247494D8|nr:InlB B-repeat-containing protein [Aurantimicrobium minutum]MDH6532735.1 putative repeat protein (TIGR02543 family) [Aurantimicrobium minutum]
MSAFGARLRVIFSTLVSICIGMFTIFVTGVSAQAVVVDANYTPIAFSNNIEIGTNAAVGYTHRYTNAVVIGGQAVDVIFTVASKTTGGTISKVDEAGAPSGATNAMINSTVNFSGSSDSITYQLDFVEGGTTTPITLQNVAINVGDIDLQQFAQFAGITSYKLSAASQSPASNVSVLTPQTATGSIPAGSYRFQSTSSSSTAANEENWVEVIYGQVNSVEIVLGATQSGGAYFSIDFQPSLWPATPVTTTPAATSYTISYDGNTSSGGTVPGPTNGTGSQTILGNSGSLVKPGYTFAGWNTSPNGTGATYTSGSSIIPINNTTLYALWTQGSSTYTLSYDSNNAGTGGTPSNTIGSGSTSTAPNSGNLTRPGYTFSGWNTQADGSGISYQPGDALNLTSNITLYAMWAPALATTGINEVSWSLLPLGLALTLFGFSFFFGSRIRSLRRH